ncbi:ciliary microtubule inner protein 2B isoform X2 [Pan troglodytes]|uniref:ciliary microtubule inner protein 2B isoform X2 n=1 Tax=Pan troglodytes TaxID=9598 RepID=UPI0023F4E7E0|nr:protein FAM166B isoform X2 [Pan troglodytes]
MAVASTFIPGLNPQNPHYIPGMGQTYGQVTGQLLRGPPGLAWPPVHRTLLPPIRPPRSPEVPRESLPLRRGQERLSSSMIPGYTGFVPRAQFIFAKNCSQVWAEALSDFTHLHEKQGSEELPKEAKGRKDTEEDQVPEPEGQLEELTLEVVEQASPYSMDDRDPRKFFMSAFLCSPTRHCRNLGRSTHQAVPRTPNISPRFPEHTLRTWVFYLTNYGGYVPGYKFQFGHTFGHLTHDALGLSTFQKQLLAWAPGHQVPFPFHPIPAILLEGRKVGGWEGGGTQRENGLEAEHLFY